MIYQSDSETNKKKCRKQNRRKQQKKRPIVWTVKFHRILKMRNSHWSHLNESVKKCHENKFIDNNAKSLKLLPAYIRKIPAKIVKNTFNSM